MLGKRLKDYMDKDEYDRIHRQAGLAMKNLIFIVNITTKETKRIPKDSKIPIGWKKGDFYHQRIIHDSTQIKNQKQ